MRSWRTAFVAFRFADGLSHGVVPLLFLDRFGGGAVAVAGLAAAMNLVSVPALGLWARHVGGGPHRRRVAVAGFAMAALALVGIAVPGPPEVFVASALLFAVFGVASAPAAGVLAIEGRPEREWGQATAEATSRLAAAYLLGLAAAMALLAIIPAGFSQVAIGLVAAAAAAAATGTLLAWKAIPPFDPANATARRVRAADAPGYVRRLERVVFFPARLRHVPRGRTAGAAAGAASAPGEAGMAGFHVGIALLLAGPVMLLAGYPAILLERLGLVPAVVLLAQMPASLSSQFAFGPAARLGTLWGDRAGLGIAGLLRIVAVGGIGAIVVFASGGAVALVPLLLLHAVLGVGFALMQVNGICRAVALHPAGTAAAVGAFHMAGGVGMVVGAVSATVLAFWWPLWVACAAALACTCLGAFLAFHHKGQEAAPG